MVFEKFNHIHFDCSEFFQKVIVLRQKKLISICEKVCLYLAFYLLKKIEINNFKGLTFRKKM